MTWPEERPALGPRETEMEGESRWTAADELLALIDLIYDAAVDPGRWAAFLARIG